METDDLVQVTLIRALDQIGTFEPRGEGAFLAYLVQILKNQIRDEIRWHGHRVPKGGLSQDPPDPQPSPLESLIGRQSLEMYELALQQLPAEHREAVILRIEMGFSHQEIARAIGSPSPNAARMLVSRALVTLAQKMNAAR
jgi:RNA polymerase sigma-70 factor (ECF subfamily)